MIMVTMSANNATNIAASLGGVSGTLIPGTDSGTTATIRTLIFCVINPPSGSQTATVSWTTSMYADVGVITVSGADQTTPCTNGTFAATNSAPTPTTSVTITSNPGDLTASVGYTIDAAWSTQSTNQTLKWGIDSGATGGDIGPGTGATTHIWTDQFAGESHAVAGANFKAAAQFPDFTLSASPSSQTVTQGGSTSYNVTTGPTGGFSGQVNLSVSGLPKIGSATCRENAATAAASLSVKTSTSTPAGACALTITGIHASPPPISAVALVVTATPPPELTLSASPSTQTVTAGASSSYNVTIGPTGGFSGQVNLSVSGLP